MTWSRTLPTEPGPYWIRDSAESRPDLIKLVEHGGQLLVLFFGTDLIGPLDPMRSGSEFTRAEPPP